jgi:hypothetical protein
LEKATHKPGRWFHSPFLSRVFRDLVNKLHQKTFAITQQGQQTLQSTKLSVCDSLYPNLHATQRNGRPASIARFSFLYN